MLCLPSPHAMKRKREQRELLLPKHLWLCFSVGEKWNKMCVGAYMRPAVDAMWMTNCCAAGTHPEIILGCRPPPPLLMEPPNRASRSPNIEGASAPPGHVPAGKMVPLEAPWAKDYGWCVGSSPLLGGRNGQAGGGRPASAEASLFCPRHPQQSPPEQAPTLPSTYLLSPQPAPASTGIHHINTVTC